MAEPLSPVRLPGRKDVGIVLIRTKDGKVIARTVDELQAPQPKEGGKT